MLYKENIRENEINKLNPNNRILANEDNEEKILNNLVVEDLARQELEEKEKLNNSNSNNLFIIPENENALIKLNRKEKENFKETNLIEEVIKKSHSTLDKNLRKLINYELESEKLEEKEYKKKQFLSFQINKNKKLLKLKREIKLNENEKISEEEAINSFSSDDEAEVENVNDEIQKKSEYIENLRKDIKSKEKYNSIRQEEFNLSSFELFKFFCFPKDTEIIRKKNLLFGGKEMIEERMDIVYLMKKMLEFDRFKNLMLSNDQLILLDSLSKFMLDPERAKIIDINHCSYEKFIDSYGAVFKSSEAKDITLSNWVKKKYHLD